MTKAELVEQVAEDAGITKASATKALDAFVDGVKKALKKKDGKITIVGFGTFSKVRRKARNGVNPATGEKIRIKAHNAVVRDTADAEGVIFVDQEELIGKDRRNFSDICHVSDEGSALFADDIASELKSGM